MKMTTFTAILLAASLACGGTDKQPPDYPSASDPAEPLGAAAGESAEAEAEDGPAEDTAETEEAAEAEKRREEDAKKLAEALAKLDEDAGKEEARWTPALTRKAVALRNRRYRNAKQGIAAIQRSDHRTPGNAARDPFRNPAETLSFLGLKPTMTVIEFGAGAGWYTELLAPFLYQQGRLIVVGYDPEGPEDSMMTVYGRRLARFLGKSPELYGKVELAYILPPEKVDLDIEGEADLVIAFREIHGWHRRGGLAKYLANVHKALKDDGTFGVVAHRAPEGTPIDETPNGYLPEDWVIEQVEAAGFRLVEKSEVNANPKDTKDHPMGVWTLPPSLRLGDEDREKYVAIGESDRMTLKFAKVAADASE